MPQKGTKSTNDRANSWTVEVAMEATRITTDEVRERLDRGEQFTFVDTRNPTAWGESERKLPNAVRVPADEVAQHLNEIPKDRAVVTYCT
jgi:rhodanese-related sulfurtransferase